MFVVVFVPSSCCFDSYGNGSSGNGYFNIMCGMVMVVVNMMMLVVNIEVVLATLCKELDVMPFGAIEHV